MCLHLLDHGTTGRYGHRVTWPPPWCRRCCSAWCLDVGGVSLYALAWSMVRPRKVFLQGTKRGRYTTSGAVGDAERMHPFSLPGPTAINENGHPSPPYRSLGDWVHRPGFPIGGLCIHNLCPGSWKGEGGAGYCTVSGMVSSTVQCSTGMTHTRTVCVLNFTINSRRVFHHCLGCYSTRVSLCRSVFVHGSNPQPVKQRTYVDH